MLTSNHQVRDDMYSRLISRHIDWYTLPVGLLVLVLLLAAWTEPAQAQRKSGRNGGVFLEIPVGAREAALGAAVTTMTGDANQIFWNPAGTALTETQGVGVALSYNDWIAELQYTSLAVGYNLGSIGTVTLGVQAFGVSDIEANRENGFDDPILQDLVTDTNTSDTYNYLDLAVSTAYARTFGPLSIGSTFKFIRQSIDGVGATAFAFDFGSTYDVGVRGWQIAARVNNLGTDLKYYNQENPLPLTFSIGTSIYPVQTESTTLMVAVDAVKPQDSQQLIYTGTELGFFNVLFLRGGYKLNYSGVDDGGTSSRPPIETTIEKFSLGAGLQYMLAETLVKIDYAFTRMDLLDNAHRFTLRLDL